MTEDETSCTLVEDIPALTDVVSLSTQSRDATTPELEVQEDPHHTEHGSDGKASPPTMISSPPHHRLAAPTPQLVHSKSLGYTSGNR